MEHADWFIIAGGWLFGITAILLRVLLIRVGRLEKRMDEKEKNNG